MITCHIAVSHTLGIHKTLISFSEFLNLTLLSRITSDLFDITELLHHGPEDILISVIKLFGALIILMNVKPQMALLCFAVVIIMLIYALIIIKCKREFLVMAEYLVSHIMLNVSPHHMSTDGSLYYEFHK